MPPLSSSHTFTSSQRFECSFWRLERHPTRREIRSAPGDPIIPIPIRCGRASGILALSTSPPI